MTDVHSTVAADPRRILHWFDLMCPFCYVGRQRNEIFAAHGLDVVHLPFQIHPEIPPRGIEAGRREGAMYTALEQEAVRAGLTLDWPSRLPNTRMALAAVEWARLHRPDAVDRFIGALFAAHFALGEDLGHRATVDRHAVEAGIDLDALHGAFEDGSALRDLDQVEALGAEFGVRATPSWLVAGRLVSGLLPPERFEQLADDAVGQLL
ncbi:DsbA family oxidoreductase [Streptomyces brasiliensis]|uniref:DSBA oxidoreductase n=1 Tax=Streptomyces brasiliensis TaxID=1954 RepID=A0A917K2L0_9ACTN|nr:DsbA family protein [Streptomyces brasiliensis]GGI97670.1 DSBA oxidoreductase [Streptomyces brasiliensis]